MFSSFNLSMFTEENITIFNNEDSEVLNKKKMLKLTQFCNFYRALGKFAAQAFKSEDFLNIFLRFFGFQAHFVIKIYLIKNRVLHGTSTVLDCKKVYSI